MFCVCRFRTCDLSTHDQKLYAFSQTSSIWLMYLSGAKEIFCRFFTPASLIDGDQTVLFQWAFYFDTLAKLAIKHWRGPDALHSHLKKHTGAVEKDPAIYIHEVSPNCCTLHRVSLLY
jgi:hypothetical protein